MPFNPPGAWMWGSNNAMPCTPHAPTLICDQAPRWEHETQQDKQDSYPRAKESPFRVCSGNPNTERGWARKVLMWFFISNTYFSQERNPLPAIPARARSRSEERSDTQKFKHQHYYWICHIGAINNDLPTCLAFLLFLTQSIPQEMQSPTVVI